MSEFGPHGECQTLGQLSNLLPRVFEHRLVSLSLIRRECDPPPLVGVVLPEYRVQTRLALPSATYFLPQSLLCDC